MPSLDLGSRQIRYSIIRGSSRRYTYFRFAPDLTLEIVVPRGRAVDLLSEVWSRRGWILSKYEQLSRTSRILDGERVMFGGAFLKIVFEESRDGERLEPRLDLGVVAVRATHRSRVEELVRRWFIKETSSYVVRRLGELSPLVAGKYKRADVREIRSWGYCTRDGRLSFSWQLVALPERLRDYIILHELTHLTEFNHSAGFKRKLRAVCPDYRERERELDLVSPYEPSDL